MIDAEERRVKKSDQGGNERNGAVERESHAIRLPFWGFNGGQRIYMDNMDNLNGVYRGTFIRR